MLSKLKIKLNNRNSNWIPHLAIIIYNSSNNNKFNNSSSNFKLNKQTLIYLSNNHKN